jgi:hypothetical protein
MRRQFAGWRVTILAADDALVRTTGLPFVERLATRNGGIPVRLLTTVRPETHAPEHAVYDIPHQEEEVP